MKHSQKKEVDGLSSRIQPLFLVLLLGAIALFFTFFNAGDTLPDTTQAEEQLQQEWEKLEADALEEQKRLEEQRRAEAQAVEPQEPVYSGEVLFTLDSLSTRRRGDDYGVIDGMTYTIVNDIAFEKELQLSLYTYDEDDDALLRNKPRAVFDTILLAPGESFSTDTALHIGFNQLDIEKISNLELKMNWM